MNHIFKGQHDTEAFDQEITLHFFYMKLTQLGDTAAKKCYARG